MEQHLERTFGDLTIRIDRHICVGFGDCIEVAPEIFVFDDEGVVTFRPDATEVERERMIQACDICPVDALAAIDAGGNQLVP